MRCILAAARRTGCIAMMLALACASPSADLAADGSGDTSQGSAPTEATSTDADPTTASGSSSSDDGADFIVRPDGGGVAAECDLWAQDCPAGEKCMPWASGGGDVWNATRCTPVDEAPGQPGDACTVEDSGTSGIDDCTLGSMCWDVDPESLTGTCAELCTGSAASPLCEDPDMACILANGGVLNVCLPRCDPLLQPCPEGQACYPISAGFVCGPDVSHELGTYGDTCAFVNGCDPGHFCAAAEFVPGCEGGACCTPFCDLDDPDADGSCPGSTEGQICVPYFVEGTAPPGYETVGACAIPQ